MLFTYFASFIGCEDGILEGISNLHVQGAQFGGKKDKFDRKSFKKLNFGEFMELIFSKSALSQPERPTNKKSTFDIEGPGSSELYETYCD